MKNIICVTVLILGLVKIASGQQIYADSPLYAEFITHDYDNFWEVFDNMESNVGNPFHEYLNNASEGLKPFVEYLNADSLYQTVLRRKSDYLRSRPLVAGIETRKKKVQATYAALKY